MRQLPLVSIIIPSFNQGKFIEQTLDSIIGQQYPRIEIIVMDGGSTDNTKRVLSRFRSKIRRLKYIQFFYVSKKDNGQVDAINKGLHRATGDIVTYINSDDYYVSGALKTIADIFIHKPNVMWVTGDCRIVNEDGKETHHCIRYYKKVFRLFPFRLVLPFLNPIAQPSTFWKKEVLKTTGYFDKKLEYAFDYDYWFRLTKRFAPVKTSEVLSSFRVYGDSKGGKNYRDQFKEDLSVVEKHVKNSVIQAFHTLHNYMIVQVYERIKKRKKN